VATRNYHHGDQWRHGDLLRHADAGTIARAAASFGVSETTVRQWIAVAKKYPPDVRDRSIDWSVYVIAAGGHPEVIEWAKNEPDIQLVDIRTRLRGDKPKRQVRRAHAGPTRPRKFDPDVWLTLGEAYASLEAAGFTVELNSNGGGARMVATLG
jgi:hypothetical protein